MTTLEQAALTTMVQMTLEEKITEIFADYQKVLSITSGDITPLYQMVLDKQIAELAVTIGDVLKQEKEE